MSAHCCLLCVPQAYSAAVQSQWQWIKQLCLCVEQHVKENAAYFQVRGTGSPKSLGLSGRANPAACVGGRASLHPRARAPLAASQCVRFMGCFPFLAEGSGSLRCSSGRCF